MWEDTIVARSTPEGNGAVGMIRLCGIDAFDIANKIILPKTKKQSYTPRKIYLGLIHDEKGDLLDEVTYICFNSPASYTGDNTVEIFCHGNKMLVDLIIDRFIASGARLALPGEFTRRAFMNGKMDLVQAESVAEIISAEAEQEIKMAAQMLSGSFSKEVVKLRIELITLIGWVEASIDFPEEEDATSSNRDDLIYKLDSVISIMNTMSRTYEEGKLIRDGVHVTIAGATNAGKSSLMNALFDEEKSIVTSIHGTTRDVVEGTVNIDGMKVIFRDTAGLREPKCLIEEEGIKRAYKAISKADIVLYVMDATKQKIDTEISVKLKNKHTVLVLNKIDLIKSEDKIAFLDKISTQKCCISALKKTGIDQIRNMIKDYIIEHMQKKVSLGYAVNKRQFLALKKGLSSLRDARVDIKNGVSEEYFVEHLKDCSRAISEILGDISPDDVLNNIFANFCIGK